MINSIRDLVAEIRIALAVHPVVTVNSPKPKQLWRLLKKELPVCDVTFDDNAVHVSWKVLPAGNLLTMSPEEQFAERVQEAGRERAERESFIKR